MKRGCLPGDVGHYFRLLLDRRDVADRETVEQVDQDEHDEEDVDEEDDPAELGGEVDALELDLAGEADDDRLHEGELRSHKVGVHLFPSIVLLSMALEYDEETEAEGDDEHDEPDQELGEVEADLAEHGDVGGQDGMTSHEEQAHTPREKNDNAREMSVDDRTRLGRTK